MRGKFNTWPELPKRLQCHTRAYKLPSRELTRIHALASVQLPINAMVADSAPRTNGVDVVFKRAISDAVGFSYAVSPKAGGGGEEGRGREVSGVEGFVPVGLCVGVVAECTEEVFVRVEEEAVIG